VPLVKGGQSIGVILFFVTKSWAADKEIIALLSRMGETVSAALDNLDRAFEKVQADGRIQYLATHDELTGLPNRVTFHQLFEKSIRSAHRHGGKVPCYSSISTASRSSMTRLGTRPATRC